MHLVFSSRLNSKFTSFLLQSGSTIENTRIFEREYQNWLLFRSIYRSIPSKYHALETSWVLHLGDYLRVVPIVSDRSKFEKNNLTKFDRKKEWGGVFEVNTTFGRIPRLPFTLFLVNFGSNMKNKNRNSSFIIQLP